MKSVKAIRVCGQLVPVIRGSEQDNRNLEGAWGLYEPETDIIWIDERTPKDKVSFYETHEALHALHCKSGLVFLMASVLGMEEDDPRIRRLEETMVRVLTPHVLETFGGPRKVG